jgi:hypothetical protein
MLRLDRATTTMSILPSQPIAFKNPLSRTAEVPMKELAGKMRWLLPQFCGFAVLLGRKGNFNGPGRFLRARRW